ncbi:MULTISPECIES: TraB/GumN family protein [unclassified Oceanispirochaeta]|uniref:TraB/GumN family protein n=1 Tax=unclassified Oceanispirochaeta TaxID=2635722 RepID=UPI000E0978FF|nr:MULTISPECIES: TraB/GumN family protein [unclassified Oceanispirochaeta]MBF9015286.1 TraB/GumN family protein [Oceanispirochaeta sp. M2]NPD71744.1 TraB/GumN family protein [Oceanispirochaeta sp. M1]RDG32936.1 TraB family protein [Oceanispirochaeta sp. M1]
MSENFTVENESDTVSRIRMGEREILILGTAHVSLDSVDEVTNTIREELPDRICVEIDAGRYQSLSKDEKWQQMDLTKVFKEKKGFLLLANLVMTSFQRKVGNNTGIKPGEDMKMAVEVAKELSIPFSFSDRPVQMTLQRAWAKSSLWNKMKLLASLISSVFANEKVDAQEVESLKEKGALEDMMNELSDYLPSVKEVLIDERDQYLASNIFEAPGNKVIAVVGAGHMNGIVRWIEDLHNGNKKVDLKEISTLPPRSMGSKMIPWIIPALILAIVVTGFVTSGVDVGLRMLLVWVLANGTLAALGAILALAHPLTVLCSFLAAPITSMNPTIGVGMVSGIMEYFFRKPRVHDMETLQDDVTTLKGWYRNRISRILLVFFFSSLGSSIGTFYALPRISMLLGG